MIEKVKIMYDLMIEKFEASPHGRHQAQTYRRIRTLADECDSVAVMTARLQNEGYNKLPYIALITDKVEAHYRAATENGLDKHAGVYRRVLDDIKANPDNAYLTGFYSDIKQADNQYAKTVERLVKCFDDYLYFRIKNEMPANAHLTLKEWEQEGLKLKDIVWKKAFREHFACSDEFLKRFADEYELSVALKIRGISKVEPNNVEEAFQIRKQEGSCRRFVAKSVLPRYRRALAMSVAPESAKGDYEYINIEFK